MADMYRYGGVKLAQVPAMPEGCSYGMIFYDEEDACYYWFCSSEMFFLDGDKYMIPASASYGGNAAKEGASAWNAATFTPEESEEVPDYYIVANTGNIIWSSADICQKDSDTVVFPTTKPLQYPTITFTGSSKLYCIGAAADSLVCNATVNDGGTLSWAWYEGETVVGTGNTFTPPTDTLGERGYCCVVTNTTEGELLTTTSGTVTIRIKELFDIRECIEWLLAGLCSRPLPMGAREPVAYLYNGVRLPDINTVWTDKETYPYALIWDFSEPTGTDGAYLLLLSEKALTVSDGVLGAFGCRVASTLTVVGHSEWPQLEEKDYTGTNHGAGYWITIPEIWTNHDILLADGTLYLAASDPPVPVYE